MPGVLNLKKSNCKNCHRCIRKCPVKSIRFTGHQAHIISDECILCGQCFVVCPQEAKEIIDDRERVGVMLQGEAPVIASFDPSFYACWEGCGANSVRKALIELGFTDAEETAIGATIVKREYERMLREAKAGCYHNLGLRVAEPAYRKAFSRSAAVSWLPSCRR